MKLKTDFTITAKLLSPRNDHTVNKIRNILRDRKIPVSYENNVLRIPPFELQKDAENILMCLIELNEDKNLDCSSLDVQLRIGQDCVEVIVLQMPKAKL
jgi:hypothetical protein